MKIYLNATGSICISSKKIVIDYFSHMIQIRSITRLFINNNLHSSTYIHFLNYEYLHWSDIVNLCIKDPMDNSKRNYKTIFK